MFQTNYTTKITKFKFLDAFSENQRLLVISLFGSIAHRPKVTKPEHVIREVYAQLTMRTFRALAAQEAQAYSDSLVVLVDNSKEVSEYAQSVLASVDKGGRV